MSNGYDISQTRLIPLKILKGHVAHYCITMVIMFKAYQSHSFFPLAALFFFSVHSNAPCQRDISPHNKHIHKLPRFMLCILKQCSESGYPQKLLNGTKQKSLKNKCDLNSYLCQTLQRNPLSQMEDMRDSVAAHVYLSG